MTLLTQARIAALICVCGVVSIKAQNAPAPPPSRPAAGQVTASVIEAVEFRGLRRLPADTARALIASQAGDKYDESTVRNDVKALWQTGRFDDIQVQKVDGRRGGVILRFTVTERDPR